MKRLILSILSFILLLMMFGCSKDKEPTIISTFNETPQDQVEELIENGEEVITTTYYELSDGTYEVNGYTYKYKLVITGRLNNAAIDTTYTILSNRKDITFEEAWKASGLSSNMQDYFKVEDAVFVAIK